MNMLEILGLFSLAFSTSLGAFFAIFKIWLEKRIIDKMYLIDKQRDALDKILKLLSARPAREQIDLMKFTQASTDVLLWCPDEVLKHYALYMKNFKPEGSEEQEIHFANTLLSFRNSIGHKNKNHKLTPELITATFKSGNPVGA